MYADKPRLKATAIATLLACSAIYGYAQDEVKTEHFIDNQLRLCLDSNENQTTIGMIQCTNRAEDLWDIELNKYYKLLIGLLKNDQKALLKEAQVKWLAYRDSEIKLAGDIYYNLEGTMWRVVYADRRMEIVKQRVEELKYYYDNLQ